MKCLFTRNYTRSCIFPLKIKKRYSICNDRNFHFYKTQQNNKPIYFIKTGYFTMDDKTPLSKTKSNEVTSDSIFQIGNRQELVRQAVNQGALNNILFQTRQNKIQAVFESFNENIDALCVKKEIEILHDIMNLLNQLGKLAHTNTAEDTKKQHPICKQIYRLVYTYIHYRVQGIRHHLNTRNTAIFYKKSTAPSLITYFSAHWGDIRIESTFAEHKSERLKEIEKYFQDPQITQALSLLQNFAPSLFSETITFEENLAIGNNPFSDPGIPFITPPFLSEINKLLRLTTQIDQNNHTTDTFDELKTIIAKFNARKTYEHILELLQKIYIPIECLAFWSLPTIHNEHERNFFKLCNAIGLHFSKIISYDLLAISDDAAKQAKKILGGNNSTEADKIKAARILKYSSIPWYLIRNISALLFRSTHINHNHGEFIIFQARSELMSSWQSLLPSLQDLITYELSVLIQPIDFATIEARPIPESQYALLRHLGDYAGDMLFLHKIISVLSELDFDQPFLIETHLRILSILGESAKNLSPLIKKLIGNAYWNLLAKTRDRASHTTGFLRRLSAALESDSKLADELKNDLQLLFSKAKTGQQLLPDSWDNIKNFYCQNIETALPLPNDLGGGLNAALEALDPLLTQEDYKELRETKKHADSNLEQKRDEILKVINGEIPANSVNQGDFFLLIDALHSLSKNYKDAIKEVYKKLKQNKPATLKDNVKSALQNIKSTPNSELSNAIESLIKNLKSTDKPEVLNRELTAIGLQRAIDVWEEKRKKCFEHSKNNDQKSKKSSTKAWSLDGIISDSIHAAENILAHLGALKKITGTNHSSAMLPLEQFWKNPILCHAVEFHFTRIRIYVDIIQEALDYLPRHDTTNQFTQVLNALYRLLSLKLQKIRLYGNSLAHLHDVTDFDGRTIHGHRFTAYQELWAAIENHQSLTPLTTDIMDYIEILITTNQKIKNDRLKKLDNLKKTYDSVYKWQQQALAKLPNCHFSDYQILTTLSTIDDRDSQKPIKQQLYKATQELCRLHLEILKLKNLLQTSANYKKQTKQTNKYANINNGKLIFEETVVVGDGWCTLNAAGVEKPAAAIEELKKHLNNAAIIKYIRMALENNYHASLALGEHFDIMGMDQNNNSIKDTIVALHLKCEGANEADKQQVYLEMMTYLERPEVQLAYLDYLLKTRYVDSNVAAACLHLQGKQVALFIDYNLPDGQLVDSTEDNVSPTNPNTVCLIFHPNGGHLTAHYNVLKIPSLTQQSNNSVAALMGSLGMRANNSETENPKSPSSLSPK